MKLKLLPVFAALLFCIVTTPTQAASASCLDRFRSFTPLEPSVHPTARNEDYPPIESAVWYTNNHCLLVGSTSGLWLYDIDQPDHPIRLARLNQRAIYPIAVNPVDSIIAFSVAQDSTVYLIHSDGTTSTLPASGEAVTAITFSPDGSRIAVASANILDEIGYYFDSRVQIWNLSDHYQSEFSVSNIDVTVRLFFTQNNDHLLTDSVRQGYGDDDIYYWDLANGSEVWEYEDLFRSITKPSPNDPLNASIAVMHDHAVAFGGLDGYFNDQNYYGSGIHIWDAETKERTQQIVVSDDGCYCGADQFLSMAFNSDGSQIVSSQNDGTIKFWNVADGKQTGEFDSGLQSPQVSFSPDDQFLALQSSNQILIWDIANQRTYTSLQLGS